MLNPFDQKRQIYLSGSSLGRTDHLDTLDVAILREMTQAQMILPGRPGVTPSMREVARKVDLPAATVRYRIQRMYASGVIRGSSVFPNFNLLGLKGGAYTVDVSPLQDKSDVVRRLREIQGVISIHDFVGSLVWSVFAYPD